MVHAAFMLKEAVLVLHLEQEIPTALDDVVIINRATAAGAMRCTVALKRKQRQSRRSTPILRDRTILIRANKAPATVAHLLLLEPFQTGSDRTFRGGRRAIDIEQRLFHAGFAAREGEADARSFDPRVSGARAIEEIG